MNTSKALENFEEGLKTVFKVPKETVARPKKGKKKRAKSKTSARGPSRDSGGEA
jgi:hypothetical protein